MLVAGALLAPQPLDEARLRLQSAALEASANAIVVTDGNGHIRWANPAFTRLTGYTLEEVAGLKTSIFKSGQQGQEFYARLWQTIRAGKVWQGELVNRRKDGSLYTEEQTITPVRDDSGAIAAFIAIKQDVTRRTHAEEAMRASEARYRTLAESAPIGIYQTTASGETLYASPYWEKISGRSTAASMGYGWMAAVHPDDREATAHCWQEAVKAGADFLTEFRIVRPDGETRCIVSHAAPLRGAGGIVTGYVGTVQDITEQKRSARELEEREAQLRVALEQLKAALAELQATQEHIVQQERLRALGEMASGIAHDLNNALAPVVGFAELLQQVPAYLKDQAKAKQCLHLIQIGAEDAAGVVRRLREFYRPRDTNELLHPVDLPALVAQVVALTQPKWKDQAQAAGCTVTVEADYTPVPPVMGNEPELREALTNLVFNAVDAMPNGGRLTLRTRFDVGRAVVEVSDTGVGMPEEVQRRCLEPFFSTKGERGTGLGLSMVHGIVRRHDGTLHINSASGRGTTVRIELPTATGAGQTPNAPAAAPPVAALHVLVVDDDPAVRAVTEGYLSADGHTTVAAASGRKALERCRRERFDLVITDRAMPGMNGDTLARMLREIAPTMPVILLTGFGDLMEARGVRPQGISRVVGKPVTRNVLREALAAVVKGGLAETSEDSTEL